MKKIADIICSRKSLIKNKFFSYCFSISSSKRREGEKFACSL